MAGSAGTLERARMGRHHCRNETRGAWHAIACARIAQAGYHQVVNDENRLSSVEHLGLAHPLPAGLRDLLAEETFYRRSLARRILEHFALHVYDLVTPPVFELAEVLEKGLGTLDPGDMLRFVEPESGEVCALRPDMTPQIARMVATRLLGQPAPIRLCYEGTIVRRRQGRARRHRQVPQAGVELYGAPAPLGDEEALRILASVSRCVGLPSFVIDLGHAGISRSLVDVLPEALTGGVTDALVHKDRARLESLLAKKEAVMVPGGVRRAIEALPDLSGGFTGRSGADVLAEAKELFRGTPAERPLAEVTALWETAQGGRNDELGEVLRIDLGEVRHFAYYTGIIFHAVAPGPGEPYASGGRYDDLLERFGHPMPAVGFALHLDALARARNAAGVFEHRPHRVLVAMHSGGDALVKRLRAECIAAVEANGVADAMRYARGNGFAHVVRSAEDGYVRVTSLRDGGSESVVGLDGALNLLGGSM